MPDIPKTTIIETLSRFRFGNWYPDDTWNEPYSLAVEVSRLSERLSAAGPLVEAPLDEELRLHGLTTDEIIYTRSVTRGRHAYDMEALMTGEGWSVRRCHMELVSMLRALIALHPEELAEFDVVVPGEVVSGIERRETDALKQIDAAMRNEGADTHRGQMLRLGFYLGAKASFMQKSPGEAAGFLVLMNDLVQQLGGNDALRRPARTMKAPDRECLMILKEDDRKDEAHDD